MSIKLLFADDSVTMQKVIQLTLEDEDVELLFAADGNRAFTLAREEHPDVVIADVYMPGMDGFQLCEMLKKTPETSAIPVILISGELENYDPEQGVAAGAVGHITKPFKSGEFIELIKKYSAAAGESSKKQGRSAGKAAPAAVTVAETEDEEGEFVPAVMKLTARAPALSEGAPDSGEDLEVVDEDIDDLAEDLDDLDEEIEGEVLEEEEDEAEAEAGDGDVEPGESSARKGKTDMDDMLPTTEEVDAAIAAEAVEEAGPMAEEEPGIYGDYGGEVVAVATGEELPPARGMAADDVTQNLSDVLYIAENRPAELNNEETRRGDDALEDAIASLDRAVAAPISQEPPPMAAPAAERVPERDLRGTSPEKGDRPPVSAAAGPDAPNEGDSESVWDPSTGELEEAVRREVESSAPPIISAETGGLAPERLEELIRETVGRAVDEFIAARAEEIFRGEMRQAIDARFKESLDTQMEKVFREEIGRVMAAGFQKAMPRMLAIIDKITVEITPRIAQQMIKIAIERIKKGELD